MWDFYERHKPWTGIAATGLVSLALAAGGVAAYNHYYTETSDSVYLETQGEAALNQNAGIRAELDGVSLESAEVFYPPVKVADIINGLKSTARTERREIIEAPVLPVYFPGKVLSGFAVFPMSPFYFDKLIIDENLDKYTPYPMAENHPLYGVTHFAKAYPETGEFNYLSFNNYGKEFFNYANESFSIDDIKVFYEKGLSKGLVFLVSPEAVVAVNLSDLDVNDLNLAESENTEAFKQALLNNIKVIEAKDEENYKPEKDKFKEIVFLYPTTANISISDGTNPDTKLSFQLDLLSVPEVLAEQYLHLGTQLDDNE